MCSHGNHRDGLGTYIARGDRDIVDRVDRDRCCDDILGPRFVLAAPGLCLGNPGPRMLPEARHPASTAVLSAPPGLRRQWRYGSTDRASTERSPLHTATVEKLQRKEHPQLHIPTPPRPGGDGCWRWCWHQPLREGGVGAGRESVSSGNRKYNTKPDSLIPKLRYLRPCACYRPYVQPAPVAATQTIDWVDAFYSDGGLRSFRTHRSPGQGHRRARCPLTRDRPAITRRCPHP